MLENTPQADASSSNDSDQPAALGGDRDMMAEVFAESLTDDQREVLRAHEEVGYTLPPQIARLIAVSVPLPNCDQDQFEALQKKLTQLRTAESAGEKNEVEQAQLRQELSWARLPQTLEAVSQVENEVLQADRMIEAAMTDFEQIHPEKMFYTVPFAQIVADKESDNTLILSEDLTSEMRELLDARRKLLDLSVQLTREKEFLQDEVGSKVPMEVARLIMITVPLAGCDEYQFSQVIAKLASYKEAAKTGTHTLIEQAWARKELSWVRLPQTVEAVDQIRAEINQAIKTLSKTKDQYELDHPGQTFNIRSRQDLRDHPELRDTDTPRSNLPLEMQQIVDAGYKLQNLDTQLSEQRTLLEDQDLGYSKATEIIEEKPKERQVAKDLNLTTYNELMKIWNLAAFELDGKKLSFDQITQLFAEHATEIINKTRVQGVRDSANQIIEYNITWLVKNGSLPPIKSEYRLILRPHTTRPYLPDFSNKLPIFPAKKWEVYEDQWNKAVEVSQNLAFLQQSLTTEKHFDTQQAELGQQYSALADYPEDEEVLPIEFEGIPLQLNLYIGSGEDDIAPLPASTTDLLQKYGISQLAVVKRGARQRGYDNSSNCLELVLEPEASIADQTSSSQTSELSADQRSYGFTVYDDQKMSSRAEVSDSQSNFTIKHDKSRDKISAYVIQIPLPTDTGQQTLLHVDVLGVPVFLSITSAEPNRTDKANYILRLQTKEPLQLLTELRARIKPGDTRAQQEAQAVAIIDEHIPWGDVNKLASGQIPEEALKERQRLKQLLSVMMGWKNGAEEELSEDTESLVQQTQRKVAAATYDDRIAELTAEINREEPVVETVKDRFGGDRPSPQMVKPLMFNGEGEERDQLIALRDMVTNFQEKIIDAEREGAPLLKRQGLRRKIAKVFTAENKIFHESEQILEGLLSLPKDIFIERLYLLSEGKRLPAQEGKPISALYDAVARRIQKPGSQRVFWHNKRPSFRSEEENFLERAEVQFMMEMWNVFNERELDNFSIPKRLQEKAKREEKRPPIRLTEDGELADPQEVDRKVNRSR